MGVEYCSSSNSSVTMKSFVATLACLAVAGAQYALPYSAGVAGYSGYPYATAGYPYSAGYAGLAAGPVAAGYAAAPGGLYAGAYDPSVAYANLSPAAEPYIHQEIP